MGVLGRLPRERPGHVQGARREGKGSRAQLRPVRTQLAVSGPQVSCWALESGSFLSFGVGAGFLPVPRGWCSVAGLG